MALGRSLFLEEMTMLKVSDAGRQMPVATALIALVAMASSLPAHASTACLSLTAPALEIQAVDCQQSGVWSQLRASQQFPDVFAGAGKMTNICYMSTGPAAALLGNAKVTIVPMAGLTTWQLS
jgi:hypothetical protein